MNLFGNNCGYNTGCSLFNGNDTILWFIILFLLIFCNNGCGASTSGCGNDCGCSSECC